MSAAAILHQRPLRYGHGPDLPLGTYCAVQVAEGVWTVERRIGAQCWYPLTARTDPEWRTWPSDRSCRRAVYDDVAMAYTCGDWPHWGSLS